MLPLVLVLIEDFGRALEATDHALTVIVEVYGEAMEDWRRAARKYPFAE